MKNRKLLLVVSLLLALTISLGGTLAYLTDTDSDVNVMTLGNVEIEQLEQQLAADGTTLEPFVQGKDFYPGTVLSKIVSVENTGKSDAYFRTLIAFEDVPGSTTFNVSPAFEDRYYRWNLFNPVIITLNESTYVVYEAVYYKALEAGQTSPASMTKVDLATTATNADMAALGGTYEILVLSQACQTVNMPTDPVEALNTAFGPADTDNVTAWFAEVYNLKRNNLITSAEQAYDATLKSGEFSLLVDYKTSETSEAYSANRSYAIRDDKDYTINLNGHTITHDDDYGGYTYLYTVAYRSKLTINGDGTITSCNPANPTDYPGKELASTIVYAQSTGEVVINGGDYRAHNGVLVWAGSGSHITINDGTFIATGDGNHGLIEMIYSSGGVIDIYGGFFHHQYQENRPVNVANANRGTGFINIYGGTFVNFDPSTDGDDPNNILVADGYKVVSETQTNGDVWYTVVKE